MELVAIKNGNAFLFSEKDKPKWKAELMSSFWGQKIAIVNLESNKIAAIVSKKLRLIFNGRTTITFTEDLNNQLTIPFKFFTSQIDFEYKGNYYEFIEHSGLKYSIFKDDKQIGIYKKQEIYFLNKDGIILRINDNVNIPLIICILTITDLNFYNTESAINTNVGNLIVSKRKFDEKWKPS
ncbi:MAG: hypothetical protein IM600_10130 [Bacteroidetes bacterium]|nr:hypothetical protein [Bacteroidota bacterium]MCA6443773.1 hypothetical protein [Bacteroidota bacterium]